MVDDIKNWGEPWSPEIEHSDDYSCPRCYWKPSSIGSSKEFRGWLVSIVGFSLEAPGSFRGDRLGAFIIECANCFTKYYFHASPINIALCKLIGKWPAN